MIRSSRVGAFHCMATVGLVALLGAAAPTERAVPLPGMRFRLKVTLREVATNGHGRTLVLGGRGAFAAGHGRVDIDSVQGGPIHRGDIFIIQDTIHTLWASGTTGRVVRMNTPLINPLEGISDRLTGSTGLPSDLKVVFDTVSLNETVNGMSTRHFRITADATYPISTREIHQRVVVEQWLATFPVTVANPFGSRIRGLPDAPLVSGQYRAFINTLAAANRVFGEAVTVKTLTTTNYNYGGGMGEDHYQTVELLDLTPDDINESLFELPISFKKKPTYR